MGRPLGSTKRTEELTARIAEWISYGLSNKEVCALAHIHPDTFYEWSKDEEFAEAIEEAIAQRTLQRIKTIDRGDKNWVSTAWILERMFPHRFARPEVALQFRMKDGDSGEVKEVVDAKQQFLADLAVVTGNGKKKPLEYGPR
jgi:hypothetical protein